MAVGSMGRHVDLLSCLPEQFLGFRSMAAHVELVGVLCGVYTADGLVNEALRGSKIRVPRRIDRSGQGYATRDKSEDQRTVQNYTSDIQGDTSCATRYQIPVEPGNQNCMIFQFIRPGQESLLRLPSWLRPTPAAQPPQRSTIPAPLCERDRTRGAGLCKK
jgi:hypothetical protein